MTFRRPLVSSSSKEVAITHGLDLHVLWATGNTDTIDVSVMHAQRGSVQNTFVVGEGSPTPSTPSTASTPSVTPSPSAEDGLNNIEKELRTKGLDKFVTVSLVGVVGVVGATVGAAVCF